MTHSRKLIDLTGHTFSRFTVISKAESKTFEPRWLCRCECGNEKIVLGKNLRYGLSKSCGCLTKDFPHNTKHGYAPSKTRCSTYTIWNGMRARCYNPNSLSYKKYGGRGVTVCEEWREAFLNFLNDMGERPSKKHSLDRFPDNNGSYSKSNCRWATSSQQARNTRTNRIIEFNGEKHCIADWSDITGISASTIYNRIKRGWSVEDALTRK